MFLEEIKSLIENLNTQNVEQIYMEVHLAAGRIALEEFRKEEDNSSKITKRDIGFRKLIYDGKAFSDREIPFHEWEDYAKTVLKVVKEYLESDTTDYDDLPSAEEYDRKFNETWERLSADPRYANRFIELMGY